MAAQLAATSSRPNCVQVQSRRLSTFAAGTLLSVITWLALRAAAPLWMGMQPASCMPDACFCEIAHGGHGLAQPANTLSSLAYVFAGLWIARSTWPGHGVLAASAILIGLGSALYHASLTFFGQFLDVFGMHALALFMLLKGLARFRPPALRGAYPAALLLCALVLWFVPETRRSLFALLLLAGVGIELAWQRLREPGRNLRNIWAGLLVFACGYSIWLLDNTRVLCAPASWFQGHAVWHLAGALATLCLARHYAANPPAAALTR